jgi:hypothetical protein
MVIERTTDELVIRLPYTTNTERMQDVVDYLRYKELTLNYSSPQAEVDTLAQEINRDWWRQNQSKY